MNIFIGYNSPQTTSSIKDGDNDAKKVQNGVIYSQNNMLLNQKKYKEEEETMYVYCQYYY